MLKKTIFDEITTMQAKQQDTLVTFQTTHFTMLSVALQYKVLKRLLRRGKH